jgi:peptide-methionine (R)-S-oxide reductase
MFTRKANTDTRDETTYEVSKSDEEWRAELPSDRYAVLRKAGTEPAWSGELLHVDGEGVFRCAGCGAELFDSDAKFESGSGWPSFDRARNAGTIIERSDRSFGMTRTEIMCARCGGHLGHVFPDGPTDTGLRYCVNSLALTYEPETDTAGDDRPAAEG